MSDGLRQSGGPSSRPTEDSPPSASLRPALLAADEPERYRLLASLFAELAAQSTPGRPAAEKEQVRTLAARLQMLAEEKANLEDQLTTTQADLAHRINLYESEQVRSARQRQTTEEQRGRLEALQKVRNELEAELVAKNDQAHKAETERERLLLQLQRVEARGADQSNVTRLEALNCELRLEVERLRADTEQARLDKDEEIRKLTSELEHARDAESKSVDAMLARLWEPLAMAKPSLADGHVPPNGQAARRLAEGYAELARFADEVDKSLRVFLEKYTKHNASVKVPWSVYAKQGDVLSTARHTLAVQGGQPVGLLKMRLRMLHTWCQAALIGSDSAVESIASELQSQLLGPLGTGSDPNRTIRDYLRDDGQYLFMEHMRELRSVKLAEMFGRGA